MRLDLFLKLSRLVPRRSLAQEFCEAGRVTVNGSAAKASRDVKSGDELQVKWRNRRIRARVMTVPTSKNVSKASAGDLYELLEDRNIDDDLI